MTHDSLVTTHVIVTTINAGDVLRDYRGRLWTFRRALRKSQPDKVVGLVSVVGTEDNVPKVFYDVVFPGLQIS